LQGNPVSPILLAGMGQIELMENKQQMPVTILICQNNSKSKDMMACMLLAVQCYTTAGC
jgi:hypothetical protein